MNLINVFKRIYFAFEENLMKNHSCISCGREIPDGTFASLCDKCFNSIEKISGKICAKCGDKLSDNNLLCEHCKDMNFSFQCNRSFCYYNETSAKIIKNFKYGGRRYYAPFLAELMTFDPAYFEDVDLISFVPISQKRKSARGFNQAELLAMEISKLTKIECDSLLTKDNTTKNQAKLNQKERMQSLSGTLHVEPDKMKSIEGKTVLIVDDVFTTGSTLSECSKEIYRAKPKAVKTLTFAKTKFVSLI